MSKLENLERDLRKVRGDKADHIGGGGMSWFENDPTIVDMENQECMLLRRIADEKARESRLDSGGLAMLVTLSYEGEFDPNLILIDDGGIYGGSAVGVTKVSSSSPIGRAILESPHVGRISYQAPDGEVVVNITCVRLISQDGRLADAPVSSII